MRLVCIPLLIARPVVEDTKAMMGVDLAKLYFDGIVRIAVRSENVE